MKALAVISAMGRIGIIGLLLIISMIPAFGQNATDCPKIYRSGDTLKTDLARSYQWFLNGQAINGANKQSMVANRKGNYTVEVEALSEARRFYVQHDRYVIKGMVRDLRFNPLSEVKVTLGNQTTTTDTVGRYYFTMPHEFKRIIVQAEKQGFYRQTYGFFPAISDTQIANIFLSPDVFTHRLEAKNGGIIAYEGFNLSFPPNAVANEQGTSYDGEIFFKITGAVPENLLYLERMQGGNGWGRDANGNEVAIKPWGYLQVEMFTEKGNALKLKKRQKVSVAYCLSENLYRIAPQQIALWHFDEPMGQWIEEGTAEREGKNSVFYADLSHFSAWMWGSPFAPSYVIGRAMGCNGLPAAGTYVVDRVGLNDTINYNYYYHIRREVAFFPVDQDGFFTAVLEAEQPYDLQPAFDNINHRDSIVSIAPQAYIRDTLDRTLTHFGMIISSYAQHRPDSILDIMAITEDWRIPHSYSIDGGRTFHRKSQFVVPPSTIISYAVIKDDTGCDSITIPVHRVTLSYDCDSLNPMTSYGQYFAPKDSLNYYSVFPINNLSVSYYGKAGMLEKLFRFNPCLNWLSFVYNGSSIEEEYLKSRFPFGNHAHKLKHVEVYHRYQNPKVTTDEFARRRNYIALLSGLLHVPQLEYLNFSMLEGEDTVSRQVLMEELDTVTTNAVNLKQLSLDLGKYDRLPEFVYHLERFEYNVYTFVPIRQELFGKKLKSLSFTNYLGVMLYENPNVRVLLKSLNQPDTVLQEISNECQAAGLISCFGFYPLVYLEPGSLSNLKRLESIRGLYLDNDLFVHNPHYAQEFRELTNLKYVYLSYDRRVRLNPAYLDSIVRNWVSVEYLDMGIWANENFDPFTPEHRLKKLLIYRWVTTLPRPSWN